MDILGLLKNNNAKSGGVAKDRLKLVLVHDRVGCSYTVLELSLIHIFFCFVIDFICFIKLNCYFYVKYQRYKTHNQYNNTETPAKTLTECA